MASGTAESADDGDAPSKVPTAPDVFGNGRGYLAGWVRRSNIVTDGALPVQLMDAFALVEPACAQRRDSVPPGRRRVANALNLLVEPDGIEPTTSSMPLKRSPN
jgi:hypothetical protein